MAYSSSYEAAANTLGAELKAKGYSWRLDKTHKHPRLYISSGGKERFAVLSTTENYDTGNRLDIKRQDIARDVLPWLPEPEVTEARKSAGGEVIQPQNGVSSRVFEVKIFLMGRGILCINVPVEAVPKGHNFATPIMYENNKFGLVFSTTEGTHYSTTRSDTIVCYHFAREKVPFTYAAKSPEGFKTSPQCARLMGHSLVCDKPFPEPLLSGAVPVTKAEVQKKRKPAKVADQRETYSLSDGKTLRVMINNWVKCAREEGHEPKLSITDKGELAITIVKKMTEEL